MRHSRSSWNKKHNFTFLLILIFLAGSGCARKPWTDLLDEKQTESTIEFLDLLSARTELCSEGIDGDITLSYQNLFGKKNVKGYFQILSPSFIKLIVSNPFGQPVLALTSDRHTFELINTIERKYIAGSVSSYGLLHNIPPALLEGNWTGWIRGTISVDPSTIIDIRQDREKRGTWITVRGREDDNNRKTHLLIESEEGRLLSRIIEGDTGGNFVEITYEDWISVESCEQPHLIKITGLEYNTHLTVKLSDIRVAENLNKDDFRFTAPAGYMKQFLP